MPLMVLSDRQANNAGCSHTQSAPTLPTEWACGDDGPLPPGSNETLTTHAMSDENPFFRVLPGDGRIIALPV